MDLFVVPPDFKTFPYPRVVQDGRVGNYRRIVSGLKLMAPKYGIAMRQEVDLKLRHQKSCHHNGDKELRSYT